MRIPNDPIFQKCRQNDHGECSYARCDIGQPQCHLQLCGCDCHLPPDTEVETHQRLVRAIIECLKQSMPYYQRDDLDAYLYIVREEELPPVAEYITAVLEREAHFKKYVK